MRSATRLLLALAACNLPDPGGGETTDVAASTTDVASTSTPTPTTTFAVDCYPGDERCADDHTKEVCNPTGFGWDPVPCTKYQTCSEQGTPTVASCLGPCETLGESSLGCEFLAIRMRSENSSDDPADADAIVVGNADPDNPAEVALTLFPQYDIVHPEPQGVPVVLGPGETHVFKLTAATMPNTSSFRGGGVYRLTSDYPVSASLHSPLANSASNDASLLLPTRALGQDHVIPSYPAHVDVNAPDVVNGRPSYFVVIATEDDTVVEWTPRAATFGDGAAFASIAAGATESAELNRYDVIQVGAGSPEGDIDFAAQDVSGTRVRASKPVVVLGATSCARVPYGSAGGCNHLQEQVLPTRYWGTRAVAAQAPRRGDEKHVWRIYAGADNQQFVLEPCHQCSPENAAFSLGELGEYKEITLESGHGSVIKSTRPFLAVQYILGGSAVEPAFGDPAMFQAIPVEQHLRRYAFVTGADYSENYVQVIRRTGAAAVVLDGAAIADDLWTTLNSTGLNVQVADVPLGPSTAPQAHLAESADPFGITVIGYVANSAYAYPGGLALVPTNPDGG